MGQTAINYMQIRGGSSKGLYFDARDISDSEIVRDATLIAIFGKGECQIDGLGGGQPLTSKAALVSPSTRHDADLDYLFCQIVVGEDRVDTKPNCGNILAGIGVFAIEAGMIEAGNEETHITVHMVNSGKLCELVMQTPNGKINYAGDTVIAGVPGSASAIICNYKEVAGSACGSLLPTGNQIDIVDGIQVTCIDNGMPVVVIRAEDMGITGYESPAELNDNEVLKGRLQSIRLQLGPMMNLGDVDGAAVPKMCMISPPKNGGIVNTRTFIPYKCHESIGVLGAVSVATACLLPHGLATQMIKKIKLNNDGAINLSIEHPTGEFACALRAAVEHDNIRIYSAGLVRTARLLSRGQLYIPNTL